jgi:hypothetical protein
MDQIILESQFGLGGNLTMREMARETVATAQALFPGGPHAAVYGRRFSDQNILGGTYVDSAWTGSENGTITNPFNTVQEGVSSTLPGARMFVKGGHYVGAGNAPLTITGPLTINSYSGTAMIGN